MAWSVIHGLFLTLVAFLAFSLPLGSERLAKSESTGPRLTECKAINKSLSCLADVITAVGEYTESIEHPNPNGFVAAMITATGLP